jgi:hypothetical protein
LQRQAIGPSNPGYLMLLPVHHLRRVLPERWRPLFHFITRNVPEHWWYLSSERRFWWISGVAEEIRNRENLVRYDLADGCFTETYSVDRIGPGGELERGVCLVLVVHGSELMKFDCLGWNGHYHIATPYPYGIGKALQGCIWVTEKTREAQIERAMFELQRNSGYYLQTHPRRKVRKPKFDEQRLAAVCAARRRKMLDDLGLLPREQARA